MSKAIEELKEVPKYLIAIEKEGFSSLTSSYMDDFVDKVSDFKSASNAFSVSFGGEEESLIDAMKQISNEYSELIGVYNKI